MKKIKKVLIFLYIVICVGMAWFSLKLIAHILHVASLK